MTQHYMLRADNFRHPRELVVRTPVDDWVSYGEHHHEGQYYSCSGQLGVRTCPLGSVGAGRQRRFAMWVTYGTRLFILSASPKLTKKLNRLYRSGVSIDALISVQGDEAKVVHPTNTRWNLDIPSSDEIIAYLETRIYNPSEYTPRHAYDEQQEALLVSDIYDKIIGIGGVGGHMEAAAHQLVLDRRASNWQMHDYFNSWENIQRGID